MVVMDDDYIDFDLGNEDLLGFFFYDEIGIEFEGVMKFM